MAPTVSFVNIAYVLVLPARLWLVMGVRANPSGWG